MEVDLKQMIHYLFDQVILEFKRYMQVIPSFYLDRTTYKELQELIQYMENHYQQIKNGNLTNKEGLALNTLPGKHVTDSSETPETKHTEVSI